MSIFLIASIIPLQRKSFKAKKNLLAARTMNNVFVFFKHFFVRTVKGHLKQLEPSKLIFFSQSKPPILPTNITLKIVHIFKSFLVMYHFVSVYWKGLLHFFLNYFIASKIFSRHLIKSTWNHLNYLPKLLMKSLPSINCVYIFLGQENLKVNY